MPGMISGSSVLKLFIGTCMAVPWSRRSGLSGVMKCSSDPHSSCAVGQVMCVYYIYVNIDKSVRCVLTC